MKSLIVNADDFGYDPAINAAVEQAHSGGVLTSASLMIRAAYADEAIRIARRNANLGIGLHLCLNADDLPVSAEVSALPATALGLCAALALDGRRLRNCLAMQIRKQILLFRETGLTLTHLDSHMHMHTHPMVFDLVLAAALEFHVPVVRLPYEPLWAALGAQSGRETRRIVRWGIFRAFRTRNLRRLQQTCVRTASRSVGVLNPGHMTESFLCHYLADFPAGASEIFCHPAAAPISTSLAHRQRGYDHGGELAALCSPFVRRWIEDNGIRLVHFGHM